MIITINRSKLKVSVRPEDLRPGRRRKRYGKYTAIAIRRLPNGMIMDRGVVRSEARVITPFKRVRPKRG